jgi:hypothetical protein
VYEASWIMWKLFVDEAWIFVAGVSKVPSKRRPYYLYGRCHKSWTCGSCACKSDSTVKPSQMFSPLVPSNLKTLLAASPMIRESKRYTSQISSRIFTIPVIYSGLREWKRTEKPNFRSLRPVKAVGENFEVAYNIQTLVTPRQPYVRLHKQTVNRNNLVPIPICQTDASFRPTRRAKFSLLNARSISNKSTAIR